MGRTKPDLMLILAIFVMAGVLVTTAFQAIATDEDDAATAVVVEKPASARMR